LRPGAYAILMRKKHVLLTLQSEPYPEYQLPGGGIDAGESPILSLHREVLEETGWRIDNIRRIGAYRRYTYMPDYDLWAEKLCHIFSARPTLRCGPPTEAGHHAIWMDPSTAHHSLASDGDAAFLSGVLV
jgi:8-oxo-dGTP diphosphatase